MTTTLAIVLNVILDTAILGGVAYAMTHPRRLVPHRPATIASRAQLAPAHSSGRFRREAEARELEPALD
jgi:hypothetical protein